MLQELRSNILQTDQLVYVKKKAVHIVSRGGAYSGGAAAMFEMDDRYLKTIFAFFGITDFTTIAVDNLDVVGEDVEAIVENSIKKAQLIAKQF